MMSWVSFSLWGETGNILLKSPYCLDSSLLPCVVHIESPAHFWPLESSGGGQSPHVWQDHKGKVKATGLGLLFSFQGRVSLCSLLALSSTLVSNEQPPSPASASFMLRLNTCLTVCGGSTFLFVLTNFPMFLAVVSKIYLHGNVVLK